MWRRRRFVAERVSAPSRLQAAIPCSRTVPRVMFPPFTPPPQRVTAVVIAARDAAAAHIHAAAGFTSCGLIQAFNVPLKDREIVSHPL